MIHVNSDKSDVYLFFDPKKSSENWGVSSLILLSVVELLDLSDLFTHLKHP